MNLLLNIFTKIKLNSYSGFKSKSVVPPKSFQMPSSLGVTIQKRSSQLIVSLTSYPERIKYIHYTISTLLTQTIKPDRLILWLSTNEFPKKEKELPFSLKRLCKYGLEINWTDENIRSYTKLIPSLLSFPNEIIVTADDDIFYSEYWLESLYHSYLVEPRYIHCHRAHRIKLDFSGKIMPYANWDLGYSIKSQSFLNFLTGVGGVLYPPNSLYKDVLKKELFLKLCSTGDDIWFWAMAVINDTKIMIIKDCIVHLRELEGVELRRLYKENIFNGINDIGLQNITNEYPIIISKIKKDLIENE
ncbi:MAG: hypothetical protein ACK50E_08090 [Bacteroidota bacterium]|jgi:hypothetical protein